jgi:hypothetical protein
MVTHWIPVGIRAAVMVGDNQEKKTKESNLVWFFFVCLSPNQHLFSYNICKPTVRCSLLDVARSVSTARCLEFGVHREHILHDRGALSVLAPLRSGFKESATSCHL